MHLRRWPYTGVGSWCSYALICSHLPAADPDAGCLSYLRAFDQAILNLFLLSALDIDAVAGNVFSKGLDGITINFDRCERASQTVEL
jgi:hypothetical protein